MELTAENIEGLKSRIFGDVDDQLRSDLFDVLCGIGEKMEAESREKDRPLGDKAFSIHEEIMQMNPWCYCEHECRVCRVKGMCDAAQKLRDEIEAYNRRAKGAK